MNRERAGLLAVVLAWAAIDVALYVLGRQLDGRPITIRRRRRPPRPPDAPRPTPDEVYAVLADARTITERGAS